MLYAFDPVAWERLREKYGRRWRGRPPQVPTLPPGWGREWRNLFWGAYKRFRRVLEAEGEGRENARWISFGLSYMALRACAARGRHGAFPYVYRAIINAHKQHRRRMIMQTARVQPGTTATGNWEGGESPPVSSDLMLDLEDVLRRFPADDAAVCRMRLLEDRAFEEIGAALGFNPSTAQRRFVGRLGAIRAALSEYVDEVPAVIPFTTRSGERDVAA